MKKGFIIISYLITACAFICLYYGCEKEEKNTPPVAGFTITPETGTPLTIFTLDASACTDDEDLASTLKVRWDWDNDGIFDTDYTTNKIINHQFFLPGTFQVTLEVTDTEDLGNSVTRSLVVMGIVPEVTTDSVTNITDNEAACGGIVINDNGVPVTARGICWSSEPGPTLEDSHTSDGSGLGEFVSYMTGLEENTLYYVRAYATNDIGTAYGEEVDFTTINVWQCGDPVIISHVQGDVAPVSKTVTYGTVTNVAGEPTLCWITSNLGADHQAISVDDQSEASAGWYWQFNRKRGFKHDGTIRTPGTAWDDDITEESDWTPSNDPCAIELGDGWRIPAQSELDYIEEWTNWEGPWNSALKLHAAGFINFDDVFYDRGVQGVYWCSLQGSMNTGWYMRFTSELSILAGNYKSMAVSVRCVKE